MEKRIVLGSGKLYVVAYTNSIPEDTTLETEQNLLGLISGGATLEYTPTFYEAKDDLGLVSKKFITDEEVIFKSGILTWNGATLDKLCATSSVDTTTKEGKRIVKIGGAANYDGAKYVIRFVYSDAADGDVRITLVGSNEAGFEMQFQKDKETVINAEFKAQPHDANGTLVIYEETVNA